MVPMARPSPSHSGSKELVSLGKAVRCLRLEASLSQEALAHEIGIDRSYIGGIERGEHNVSLINLIKIAHALNIAASELLVKARV